MPRKPVRGRWLVVVPIDDCGGSYRAETLKDVSRSPRQIVADLREYADFIEKHFVKPGAEAPHTPQEAK